MFSWQQVPLNESLANVNVVTVHVVNFHDPGTGKRNVLSGWVDSDFAANQSRCRARAQSAWRGARISQTSLRKSRSASSPKSSTRRPFYSLGTRNGL